MHPRTLLFRSVLTSLSLIVLSASVVAQAPMADDLKNQPYITAEMITLPEAENVEFYKLTVKGPDNYHFEVEFSGQNVPYIEAFGPSGELLADGTYAFRLEMVAKYSQDAKDALAFARATGDMSEVEEMRKAGLIPTVTEPQFGYFSIKDGFFIVPEMESRTLAAKNEGRNSNEKPGDPVGGDDVVIGDVGVIDSDSGIRDQVIADDLIVDGSACIGFDCVNGEDFGFDTIRLKENNLRIKFMDTSINNFPANDWQITANDSAAGGANKFSIDDIDGGRTPFTIEARAPSHSLYVDDGGRVGLGTNTPSVEIHATNGDTAALRLEQNGTSGFAPQTWDLAGNETSFFIRDVSNGSTLPFRIRPGSSSNTLVIDSGNVGVGTLTPDTKLDVDGGSGDTTLKVQSSAGIPQVLAKHTGTTVAARREMFVLENHGEPAFRFSNTDPAAADDWSMILLASDNFIISRNGSGVVEMQISNGGNVSIAGTLSQGSDVHTKENFEEVDPLEILDRVANLPISTWNYIREEDAVRHMGPMAQDFAAVFGLGADETRLATVDVDGVMLAAIQGLHLRMQEKEADLNEKDQTIQELKKQNADLALRLEDLATQQNGEIQQRILELETLVKKLAEKP